MADQLQPSFVSRSRNGVCLRTGPADRFVGTRPSVTSVVEHWRFEYAVARVDPVFAGSPRAFCEPPRIHCSALVTFRGGPVCLSFVPAATADNRTAFQRNILPALVVAENV